MTALTKRRASGRATALVRAYTVDGPMFASAATDNTRTCAAYNSFEAAEAERRRLEALRAQQAQDAMVYNMLLNSAATAGGVLTKGASTGAAIAARVLLGAIATVFQRKN